MLAMFCVHLCSYKVHSGLVLMIVVASVPELYRVVSGKLPSTFIRKLLEAVYDYGAERCGGRYAFIFAKSRQIVLRTFATEYLICSYLPYLPIRVYINTIFPFKHVDRTRDADHSMT